MTLLAGAGTITLYLLATRGRGWSTGFGQTIRVFLPAGLLFGLSYAALFEAYYRGRVSVVAPLVATESLWGVALRVAVPAAERARWAPARARRGT